MSGRGERRQRTDRIVARRVRAAPKGTSWKKTPGKLKKRAPVCYCTMCRLLRAKVVLSQKPEY